MHGNAQLTANTANGAAVEVLMTRHGSDRNSCWIEPEVVFLAGMIELATMAAKMLLQRSPVHQDPFAVAFFRRPNSFARTLRSPSAASRAISKASSMVS